MKLTITAPGKVMLWGEYAVLLGAPAMLIAINRYATVSIASDNGTETGWQVSGEGLQAQSHRLHAAEFCKQPAPANQDIAYLLWHAMQPFKDAAWPDRLTLNQDTQPFYLHGQKLGLGSSAALMVALTAALANITNQSASLGQALHAHYNSQNQKGSGADVAASFIGGSVRFQNQAATPHNLPDGLHTAFIWTGTSTSTTGKIGSFDQWRSGPNADPTLVDELADASSQCFEAADLLSALRNFCAIARQLDASAELGIYASPHEQLAGLANHKEILYKPCGAGGGDVGVAIATDPDALQAFITQAKVQNFAVLAMEIAQDGVQARS